MGTLIDIPWAIQHKLESVLGEIYRLGAIVLGACILYLIIRWVKRHGSRRYYRCF